MPGSDDRHRAAPTADPLLGFLLGAALVVVAALTLTPQGTGWSWGAPAAELRWYLTGLRSEGTVLQLLGNLALLAVPAALAVAVRPALGRLPRLAGSALALATAIEVLQWTLPLGRVVSPLDALLNAVGAIAAGLLVRHLRQPPVGDDRGTGDLSPRSPRRCAPPPAAARPGRSPAPSPG